MSSSGRTLRMGTADRRLMWHGLFLFLVGLVTGLNERRFTNMRMALSAHLEGVMNGTFLIALGAIWGHVELSPRVEKAARWSGTLRHLRQLAVHHTWCRDGYRCSQPHLVAGPSREAVAGKDCRGRLSQHRLFDPSRRGSDSAGPWATATGFGRQA
jgi:hypothetical protein